VISNACAEIAAKRHITSSTPHYTVVTTDDLPLLAQPSSSSLTS
jgi:hypothetical protein